MNNKRLATGLVLGLLLAVGGSARAAGIEWQPLTLEQALAAAQERGTQVLVDVYATWCGPCHALDAEVFPTDVVGTAAADLVAVRVDAEAGEGPALVERYHVVGYPTVLLLRADGTEVDRVFGFMPAEEFANTVAGYRHGTGTIEDVRTQVQAQPDNLQLVFDLGFRTAVRGEYEEARALLDRVIATDGDNALGLRAQAHLVLGKYMYLRGAGDYEAALREFAILQEQFPTTPQASDAVFQTAIAYARSGDQASATAVLDRVLADAGNDSGVYNSVAWACFRENFALDRGLVIAQQGLAINPADHSLWDTYAELQNATGDVPGAIASIERAIALAPAEPYYTGQLARFQARLAEAANR